MVGSELKALTMSKRFSGSTDPSNRKYVTLLPQKEKCKMKAQNSKKKRIIKFLLENHSPSQIQAAKKELSTKIIKRNETGNLNQKIK